MQPLLAQALRALGIDRLACAVHDRCLPPDDALDLGCGAPGGSGADGLLTFLAELGFDTVLLGPPGQISAHNLSPYDGTIFSRSRLQLSWTALHGSPLATAATNWQPPADRCDYPHAFEESARRWAALHHRWDTLAAAGDAQLAPFAAGLATFRAAETGWLRTDAIHEVLSAKFAHPDPRRWPRVDVEAAAAANEVALERYAREQYLLHAQHHAFRASAHARGLELWADLQVGLSHADRFAHADALLGGYALGAPPSRTNPEGQPWGYPVLHPDKGSASFQQARARRLFRDYDGVRVDHPHGLVCPWIYEDGTADPLAAVRAGARLFSVGAHRHPRLAGFDIAHEAQLNPDVVPWADDAVLALDEAQVARYASSVDALLDAARAAGKDVRAVAFEVLSTMPYQLGRVLARHALGRFRVTQKADVTDAGDVYLPANAVAEDWVMVGTHDTPPVWRAAAGWNEAVAAARVEHAVRTLSPDGVGRDALAAHLRASRNHLACAELAVLFTTRARQVMIWIFDLLGSDALYNRPGVIHPDNWTLRVPEGYRAQHAGRAAAHAAFDPYAALALALAALPSPQRAAHADLARTLAARAFAPVPGLAQRLA